MHSISVGSGTEIKKQLLYNYEAPQSIIDCSKYKLIFGSIVLN